MHNPIVTFSSAIERGIGFKYAARRTVYQFGCDIFNDPGAIGFSFVHHLVYPDAQKMLWHYLTGNGDSVEVDTARVLKEDEGLKNYVLGKIWEEIGINNIVAGSINIQQKEGVFKSYNWMNAFGSVNFPWEKLSENTVQLWIEDTYKWHPGELKTTQCVHQALERAKQYGAKEFHYKGTKIKIKIDISRQECRKEIDLIIIRE